MSKYTLFIFVLGIALAPPTFAEVGVTDTEVVVGAHTAESGAYAVFSALPRSIDAYFSKVNEQGGVNGRKIKFIREDSQWSYQKAPIATRKLIDSDHIFAMVAAQGDSHIAAYKVLDEKNVPDLFFVDGSMGYEPLPKGAFGYMQSNETDGEAYGKYVVDNFKGKKVCFISGKAFAEDVPKYALETINAANKKLPPAQKIKIGIKEVVERSAPQADAEINKLKAEKCDAVIMTLMLPLSANIVNYATSQNFKPTWVVYFWNTIAKFVQLLNNSSDLNIVSGINIVRDDTMADTNVPGWGDYLATMKKYNVPITGLTAAGYYVADMFVEALRRAGKDLTREKLVKAVESLHDYKCSLCLNPVMFSEKNHWAFPGVTPIKLKDGHWVRQ